MKRLVMGLISFTVSSLIAIPTFAADAADKTFVRKFLNYKAKAKSSTLKTAEIFAKQQKKTTEQILNRFVRAQFSQDKNSDLAVVYGLEAFQEQGLSFEQALIKVSDLTGQMTSTLEAMNRNSRFKPSRETASGKARHKKKVAAR